MVIAGLTVASVMAGVALLHAVRRWHLLGPSISPKPFDPLPLPRWAGLAVAAWIGAAAMPAAGIVDEAWIWVPVASLAAVLVHPLVQVARISAEVFVAERLVAQTRHVRSGHGEAHSTAGPSEGALRRSVDDAVRAGDHEAASQLRVLADACRQAEIDAEAQAGRSSVSSGRAYELRSMLEAVRSRPTRLFSDPANMPARWSDRQRAIWAPFARRIDAVRAIHTHQIEWVAVTSLGLV